jgi:hypothetical protein
VFKYEAVIPHLSIYSKELRISPQKYFSMNVHRIFILVCPRGKQPKWWSSSSGEEIKTLCCIRMTGCCSLYKGMSYWYMQQHEKPKRY